MNGARFVSEDFEIVGGSSPDDEATTPASDKSAWRVLAKDAYARQEPELRTALLSAWRGASKSLSAKTIKRLVVTKNYEKLGELWTQTLTPRVRSSVEPRVSAQYLAGVQHGARPLARHGVVLRDYMEKAGDKLRFSMAAMNPKAADYARARAGDLVQDDEAAKALIKEFVERAVEDGFDVDQVADLIKGVIGLDSRRVMAIEHYAEELLLDGKSEAAIESAVAAYVEESLLSRAWTIARTEIMSAQSAGQQALWKEAQGRGMLRGVKRIWIVTDDCCDECDEMATTTADFPVDIDEDFDDDVEHPPLHPNCRCTMGLVNAGEDGDEDEEE